LSGYSADERELLAPYFTNLDDDVFVLTNLPEVVKGALFARYSRSAKSLRRLFLDEFVDEVRSADEVEAREVGTERAERLYERIFTEYGDDSVAQLGGAHLAVEGASNLLTKQLEWGRLAAYLEQSTRYIAYDDRPGGRYRYFRDPDVMAGRHAEDYVATLDAIFDTYAALVPEALEWVRRTHPRDEQTSEFVWKAATKAKALDLLRGLLPAATISNVGVFASGQAYENMLLRLRSSELAEARACADLCLTELRKVIPSFLTRVDRPDRGVVWSDHLATTRSETRALAVELLDGVDPEPVPEVSLVDFSPRDPECAEVELVAAALYAQSELPEEQIRAAVSSMASSDRQRVIAAYVGERANRRHKPGRALEQPWYRFDVLGDFGAFRDLQRHRTLTVEWQDLTTRHGHEVPDELDDFGATDRYVRALERSARLHEQLLADHPAQAQYAVCFAYRIRYVMQLNARAAMHLIELRSTPQGHPTYRRVAQEMHRLIAEEAGHRAVADAMVHVDHGAAELERLDAERRAEERRRRAGVRPG
jgi:thymidylate synthase ThyX